MTEAEWLECTDPVPMLEFLGPRVSGEKLDRYTRGCLMWDFLQRGGPYHEVAMAVGRFYDCRIAAEEFAEEVERFKHKAGAGRDHGSGVAHAKRQPGRSSSQVVREVFGNPLRTVVLDPTWRPPEIVTLARLIYDTQTFDRLPVLADALEGTGCDNADILEHCRQRGTHVRGCWVVDLLLGRE